VKRLDLIKRVLPAALVVCIVGLSLASSDSAAAKRHLRSTSRSSFLLASAKPSRPLCRPRKASCPDTTPPTAPTGVAVTATTQTGISLAWNAATDNVGVTGYALYLNGTKVGTTAQTSYGFSGLSCGTSYTVAVAAYDAAGNLSATATSAPTTSTCSDTTRPTVPGGLSVTGTTQTGISVAWSAATDNVGVTGYALYLNGTKVGTTAQTSYSFSGLTCGTSYTLAVAAYDAAGNLSSTASTVAAASACPDNTAPTAPTGVAVTATTQTGVSLVWNSATDNVGVTGYALYVNGTKVGTTAQTSYSFSGLSCGTSYTLGIAAYDAAGNVSSTPTVTAATYSCVASGPCGSAAASAPATLQHVVWIWMENQSYSSVIGNTSAAPYENQLAGQCGLATNYAGVSHPSLPNYIAATSGSTQGITDDNPPSSHPLGVASIFGQINSKSYQESMPSNCALTSSGNYAVKHNPEAYYTPVRTDCNANDMPMGSTSSGAFLNDLTNNSLPAFSFVTPDMCSDTHDCSVATGDAWLKSWVPKLLASPAYQAGQLALFITWDENDGSTGNKVPAIVASPYTPAGTTSGTSFNHYSLLRTTEELLGTTNYLGNAASAASMRSAFFSPALVAPLPSPTPPPPPPPLPPPPPTPASACTKTIGSGQSIQTFASSLVAGDVGCVTAGTYSGAVVIGNGGALGSPITLQPVPGASVTILGHVELKNGANDWRVTGFNIDGASDPQNTVQVYSLNDRLDHNDVTNERKSRSCLYIGSRTYGAADDVEIDHNRLHDCGASTTFDHGIYADQVQRMKLHDNYVYDNAAFGIQLYQNADNSLIEHNVFAGNVGKSGLLFSGDGSLSSDNNEVRYNIFTSNGSYGIASWFGGLVGTGNTVHDNCLFGNASGDLDGGSGYAATNNLHVDPLYVNASANNFALPLGSPCAGMGPS
jgi:chitodextrinase